MFKNLLLTFFLFFSSFITIYPSKKENTNLINYCYSLEKILSRNSIQIKKNVSGKVKSISQDVAKFGVGKTRGNLINNTIDQYKTSKNSFVINLIPNRVYCLSGYWIEKIKPGTFESIFYQRSKEKINEFKDLKDDVDLLLNDINLEYKTIKEEFNSLF